MASTTWPPKEGLSTPIVPRKDATFVVSVCTHINAPASVVFDAVRKISDYPKWNTLVPEVTGVKQPDGDGDLSRMQTGTLMSFMVVMNSAKPTSKTETGLLVTDMSTPENPSDYISVSGLAEDPSFTSDLSKVYRVSWKTHGGYASKGLRTERFHEIIILGENECELRVWESYGGLLARTVKWTYQSTLNDKFKLWNEELKKYAESLVAQGAAA